MFYRMKIELKNNFIFKNDIRVIFWCYGKNKKKKKFLKVENYNLVNNEYLLLIDFVFYIV